MIRNIGSIVAGIVAWIAIVTVIDRLMRLAWPEYAAALPIMTFTLPMMFARLSEGAVTTLAAGFINRLIARGPHDAGVEPIGVAAAPWQLSSGVASSRKS